jgi:hypothetical protein
MPRLEEADRIFKRVVVCKSFRLSGLHHILQRFPTETPTSDPFQLIRLVGELNAAQYVYQKSGNINDYMINPEKARQVLPTLENPSACTLHDAWHDWYRREYDNGHRVEDLAALLYHEFMYLTKCQNSQAPTLDLLQDKFQEYLWGLCRSQADGIKMRCPEITVELPFPDLFRAIQHLAALMEDIDFPAPNERREFADYISNFKQRITGLHKFDDILPVADYDAFLTFLDSLDAQQGER